MRQHTINPKRRNARQEDEQTREKSEDTDSQILTTRKTHLKVTFVNNTERGLDAIAIANNKIPNTLKEGEEMGHRTNGLGGVQATQSPHSLRRFSPLRGFVDRCAGLEIWSN